MTALAAVPRRVVGPALDVAWGLALAVARRRRLALVAAAAGAVLVVRAQVGVWPAALLGAIAATAGLIAALAALDRRAQRVEHGPRALPVEVVEGGSRGPGRSEVAGQVEGPGGHVAFARGLAAVSAWYLAECEREVQQ